MTRKHHRLPKMLHDEQGNASTSRIAFWLVLLITMTLIVLDATGRIHMATAAYSLLSATIIALAAWAAGPRMAQYIGPQIGAVAAGVSAAAPLVRQIDNPDAN